MTQVRRGPGQIARPPGTSIRCAFVQGDRGLLWVGYENPSQFSRKYLRMVGPPPRRGMAAMETMETTA